MNDERALAKKERPDYPIFSVDKDRIKQLVERNIGNKGINAFNLVRVRVPASGSTTWVIPGIGGEREAKEVRGIIVAYREPRAFWQDPFGSSGGGVPPDCSSDDGLVGVGVPGGDCVACEKAQFGSGVGQDGRPSRGQACKAMRTLFLLNQEGILPYVVSVPPTSLSAIESYFLGLLNAMVDHAQVETILTLEKASNKDGLSYSKVSCRCPVDEGGRPVTLDDEDAARVGAYTDQLRSTFEAHREFDE